MAFDATTPYAVACLSDSAKSVQSLTVLRSQEAPETRMRNLVALVQSWNLTMEYEEAQSVVTEYDRVMSSPTKSNNILGGNFNFNGISNGAETS